MVITLNWPSLTALYILSVTCTWSSWITSAVEFHYKASVFFYIKGTTAASAQPRLSWSYRRIRGADLSSVTVLRSLTPRRINTSISLPSLVVADDSRGSREAASPGCEPPMGN